MIFQCSQCKKLLWRPPFKPYRGKKWILSYCETENDKKGFRGKDVRCYRVLKGAMHGKQTI